MILHIKDHLSKYIFGCEGCQTSCSAAEILNSVTAILGGLVLESAATNQAEWMQMEMRERLGQQKFKQRIARMIARWNDVFS